MSNHRFSFKARLGSFANAWRGLTRFVRQEHNAWIHCGMTILVLLAGFLFEISKFEWLAVVFAIGLVLAGEAINSAIERLSDVVRPELDDRIRDVKDISAGAVLICAITAAIIGITVFLPKLIMLFSK